MVEGHERNSSWSPDLQREEHGIGGKLPLNTRPTIVTNGQGILAHTQHAVSDMAPCTAGQTKHHAKRKSGRCTESWVSVVSDPVVIQVCIAQPCGVCAGEPQPPQQRGADAVIILCGLIIAALLI